MKMTKREKVLLVVALVLICAAAYYILYFMPASSEISALRDNNAQKEALLDDYAMSLLIYSTLTMEKSAVEAEYLEITGALPDRFDEFETLRRIQTIFSPYTSDISISFDDAVPQETATQRNKVTLRFNVRYNEFLNILRAFGSEKAPSRITNFSFGGASDEDDETAQQSDSGMYISMQVEYITN